MNLHDQMEEYTKGKGVVHECPDGDHYIGRNSEIHYGYNFRESNGEISCSYDPTGDVIPEEAEIITSSPTFALLITKLKLLNWPKEKVK